LCIITATPLKSNNKFIVINNNFGHTALTSARSGNNAQNTQWYGQMEQWRITNCCKTLWDFPTSARIQNHENRRQLGHQPAHAWAVAATFIFLFLTANPLSARATDVFSSTDQDGQVRWSTQAWDSSYRKVMIAPISHRPLSLAERTGIIPTTTRTDARSQLEKRRHQVYPLAHSTALRHGVDTGLVMALIEVESSFNTQAVSPKGARGLMQLMPATASRYGMRNVHELHDPARNLDWGIRHLKDLLQAHEGHWALAVASYNAGQRAVLQQGQRIPNFNETMLYVPAVLAKVQLNSEPATTSVSALRQ
jgi:hypothetical protein